MATPDRAGFDSNLKPTLIALSSTDGVTPVSLWADPTTHALVTSGGGGASGGTVIIGDGTNTANILKSDGTSAGNNALKVAGSYQELASLTAGSLNADLVPSTDVSGYKTASIQLIGTSALLTITFQVSNDNTNWIPWQAVSNLTAQWSSTTINPGTGSFTIPLGYRYLRARVTSYTSGSVTGTLELHSQPMSLFSTLANQNGTWTVGSSSATGSAVPANAFYMGMAHGSNLNGLASIGTVGDASAGSNSLATATVFWNGTTHDRLRAASSASGTTGTGVPAAGMMGFDGTNYQRVKTDTSGYVGVQLFNGATGTGWSADNADGAGSTGTANRMVVVNRNTVYNGTSYDRMPGNTTGTFTVAKPTTSGGVTVAKIASAATTNATSVKASAGQIYGWALFNTSAATKYLKFYNKATAPTVGTDVPVFIVPLPAGGGSNIMLGDLGTPLTTGLAYAITGGVADTDTTAVALNDCVGSVFYS